MASSKDSNVVLLSAPGTGIKAKASSILQRNAKVYGPSNALTDDSSCWNSEGNTEETNHWFRLDFYRTVQPTCLAVQFQAGFCAQQGRIEYQTMDGSDWQVLDNAVEWEDAHESQTIQLVDCPPCTSLRIILQDCTDFYGRVILYQVQVWGQETTASTTTKADES